jgi:O-antigen/teichoic acid export membrane protein
MQIVNAVVPPLIAQLNSANELPKLEKLIQKAALYAGIPGLLVLGVISFYGEHILALVYGEYYRSAALSLTILCSGYLVVLWAGSAPLSLMLTGNQMLAMWITLFCGVLVVFGCVVGARSAGIEGVAVAIAIGHTVQSALYVYFAKRRLGIWTFANLSLLFRWRQS